MHFCDEAWAMMIVRVVSWGCHNDYQLAHGPPVLQASCEDGLGDVKVSDVLVSSEHETSVH